MLSNYITNIEKPPILSVLREYFNVDGLRQRGKRWSCRCVFHSERTPSMVIYPEQNRYHCFGCDSHGDSLDLIAIATGKTLQDVLRENGAQDMEIMQQRQKDVEIEKRFQKKRADCLQRLSTLYRHTIRVESEYINKPSERLMSLLADAFFLREIIERILNKLETDNRLEQQAALWEAEDRGFFSG